MPKFRKKPVVIEAVLWTGDNFHEVARLAGSPANVAHRYAGLPVENVTQYIEKVENGVLQVETLEGTMQATPGDYIIKGVKGELYPCKPDIFAATYEDADSPTSSLRDCVEGLESALTNMVKAYEMILPGAAKIAVQDYALINEAPCRARDALARCDRLRRNGVLAPATGGAARR